MSVETGDLKELLLLLTRALVTQPEDVEVQVGQHGNAIRLEVSCAEGDIGKVIGRGGKRAQAIRTILKAKATQMGCRVQVDFLG